MSGVYIKGMNKPASCYGCNFWIAMRKPQSSFCCAEMVDVSREEAGGVPEWCPLIPVPDHGRLGDLDRLEKELAFDYAYAAADICKAASTIIPADKEGEK